MSTLHLLRQGAPLPVLPLPVYGVGVAHGRVGVCALEPGAIVVVEHARAQQALGQAEELAGAVNALQAAWREQLLRSLHRRRLTNPLWEARDGGRVLGAAAALCCTCTDAEEAAGLCPRPVLAWALRAAGHRVVLDGVALPWMEIRAEVSRPLHGGPLAETTSCAHAHRSLAAAWTCAMKKLSPRPWTDPPGTTYRAREIATGEVLEETVKRERPPYQEEQGRIASGLRWTERHHRQARPHKDGLAWKTEATFARGRFELQIVYPYRVDDLLEGDGPSRAPHTEGMAMGIALLLGMDRERLLQLHDDYHRAEPLEDGTAEVVTLAPRAVERGPFAPAPLGDLVLFPQRARPAPTREDDEHDAEP